MTRLWIGGTVLVALVLLVAACGGGASDSGETAAAPAPSIADDGGDAADSETATTGPDGDGDSGETAAATVPSIADEGGYAEDADAAESETAVTEPDGDDSSVNDGVDARDLPAVLSSNDCLSAASALGSAFSGGFTADGTFNADEIGAAFDRMSEVAPSEIKDDLATIADAVDELFSVLEDENIDLSDPATLAAPGVQEAFERAGEKIDTSEFEEAADNVRRWFEDECGEFAG